MTALAQTFSRASSDGFSNRFHPVSGRIGQVSQQNGRMGLSGVFNANANVLIDSTQSVRDDIQELDRVRLLVEIAAAGGTLPLGTEGTAVYRYRDGAAFEVEFDAPFHALLTLRAGEIARLGA